VKEVEAGTIVYYCRTQNHNQPNFWGDLKSYLEPFNLKARFAIFGQRNDIF
jgi:hypothetical protein